jgi:hypothetical protein
MSNWFESSPARSVVIHTIVVGAAVWAAFAFVFDENKVSVFRAQVENEKATANQYKAKTEVLEVELARLRDENKKYQEWLAATPGTIPHFEAKLKGFSDENARIRSELASAVRGVIAPGTAPAETATKPYVNGKTLGLGEAFVDQKTNATIGIGVISQNFTATAMLTLPGQKSQDLPSVKAGDNWNFILDDRRYQMTVLKVDWFSNKSEVMIREIGGVK